MAKLVYLFELDSTRRSPREVHRGQAALLEELIYNGNAVVLSFNQLVDSPGFIDTLQEDVANQSILQLFRVGALRVSPYGTTRTASQYLQSAAANDGFVFSALSLDRYRADEAELIRLMGAAVRNGDLAGIDEFKEAAAERGEGGLAAKCEAVRRLASLVLHLNLEELSRNPVKRRSEGEHVHTLTEVVRLAVDHCLTDDYLAANGWLGGARDTLDAILADRPQALGNQRSRWDDRIRGVAAEEDRAACELVVDLCYNYVVEDSIWGISKHFSAFDDPAFVDDFQQRLTRYASEAPEDGHLFHSHRGAGSVQPDPTASTREWRTAEWLVNALARSSAARQKSLATANGVPSGTYEQTERADRREWRRIRLASFANQMAVLVAYAVGFVALNQLVSSVNAYAESIGSVYRGWGYSLALFVGFAILASALMKLLKVPDILDSLVNVARALGGWWQILRMEKGVAYARREGGSDG